MRASCNENSAARLLILMGFLAGSSFAQSFQVTCFNGDQALNNVQDLSSPPDGESFDGYMFDIHVKPGTFGIELKDFGGWATESNPGQAQSQFAAVRVYYTDEGVSFQEAAANASRWTSAWSANQIMATTTIENQFGAFPISNLYNTPVTISENNFRGVLLTFTGPQANFQGDSDLINFNIDGDTPQIFPEDDAIFIEGGYGYTHPFQSVSTHFYRMAGPICYDVIPFPTTGAPSPTANPTPTPTAGPTAIPSPVPTAIPTSSPTAGPTAIPTLFPTANPTSSPTAGPTANPTPAPVADIVTVSVDQPITDVVPPQLFNYYQFVLATSGSDIYISVTAATGDPDLYVSLNSSEPPTKSVYFWASRNYGSDSILIPNADAGDYYIGVYAYGVEAATYTLTVQILDLSSTSPSTSSSTPSPTSSPTPSPTETTYNIVTVGVDQPITDVAQPESFNYYRFVHITSGSDINISVTAATGDPDLYVSLNSSEPPSTSVYNWNSRYYGSDSILIPNADAGDYYIGVYAFRNQAAIYTLTVQILDPSSTSSSTSAPTPSPTSPPTHVPALAPTETTAPPPNNLILCEHNETDIECPHNMKIEIIHANYGRTATDVCEHPLVWDTSCTDDTHTERLRQACDGRNKCRVRATNAFWGDTCPNIYKYLDVDYICVETTTSLPSTSTSPQTDAPTLAPTETTVPDGIVMVGINETITDFVPRSAFNYYQFVHTTSGGNINISVIPTTATGDPDLYVSLNFPERPSPSTYNWTSRSYGPDSILIPNADAGDYYIGVQGYTQSTYTLTVDVISTVPTTPNTTVAPTPAPTEMLTTPAPTVAPTSSATPSLTPTPPSQECELADELRELRESNAALLQSETWLIQQIQALRQEIADGVHCGSDQDTNSTASNSAANSQNDSSDGNQAQRQSGAVRVTMRWTLLCSMFVLLHWAWFL